MNDTNWINVHNSLPEEDTKVLVTLESGCVIIANYTFKKFRAVSEANTKVNECIPSGNPVVAWMPFPEPYKIAPDSGICEVRYVKKHDGPSMELKISQIYTALFWKKGWISIKGFLYPEECFRVVNSFDAISKQTYIG